MENRHALVVDCRVTQADGYGERDAAKEMVIDLPGRHQRTVGADKHDDTREIVAEMRRIGVTPHVAQNSGRSGGSVIDGGTIHHKGDAKSIHARRGIEGESAQACGGGGVNRPFSRDRDPRGSWTSPNASCQGAQASRQT